MQAKAIISFIHNRTVFIKKEAKSTSQLFSQHQIAGKSLLFYLYVN